LRYLEAEIDLFIQQYGRTSRRSAIDPNDRRYRRDLEEIYKRMDPWEFNELLYGEGLDDERENEPELRA